MQVRGGPHMEQEHSQFYLSILALLLLSVSLKVSPPVFSCAPKTWTLGWLQTPNCLSVQACVNGVCPAMDWCLVPGVSACCCIPMALSWNGLSGMDRRWALGLWDLWSVISFFAFSKRHKVLTGERLTWDSRRKANGNEMARGRKGPRALWRSPSLECLT